MNDFQGIHGAGNHAGLLSGRSAWFAEVRGVGAEIALGSLVDGGFPNGAVGSEGTRLEAGLAADAPGFVGSADVAVGGVDMAGTGRAVGHTQRFGALSADGHLDIIWIAGKYAAGDLDTGKGQAGFPFMNQRAGQHTALTAGALAAVVNQIGARLRIVGCFGRHRSRRGCGIGAQNPSCQCGAAAGHEMSPGIFLACSFSDICFLVSSHGRFLPKYIFAVTASI